MYTPLLKKFATTDGLIRGTRVINMVVVTAAFALLPGFGVHGLFISSAIQDIASALVEIPFGWVADRFGWAKAVLISYGLKFIDTLAILGAVTAAYYGAKEWIWFFIAFEAVFDAFIISLQDGAYEAAYSEWYRTSIKQKFGDSALPAAPPLFIRSLRYAMRVRLVLPFVVLVLVFGLQLLPTIGGLNSYSATFVALGIILVLRFVVFARVWYELRPMMALEKTRILRSADLKGVELVRAAWKPIREHFALFLIYASGGFLVTMATTCVMGSAMRQMNELAFPEPYGWLTSISVALVIYTLDSLFWMFLGYRMDRTNAPFALGKLTLLLSITAAVGLFFYFTKTLPVIQGSNLALCALLGIICGVAIKRYMASYVQDWLKSDLVATWLSLAECTGLLVGGVFSALFAIADSVLPSVVFILLVMMVSGLALRSQGAHRLGFAKTA